MIDAAAIKSIIALYSKHGWTLRRVLLSGPLRKHLSDASVGIFASADVAESELDAAWFSRSSQPGRTAWEIRHLSDTPFALVEVLDDEIDAEQAAQVLREAEMRMMAATAKRPPAN